MAELRIIPSSDRLRQRRKNVETTLRHLEKERRQVEENTQWMDRFAYRNRLRLLERLTHWYREEMGQIDAALGGSPKRSYGLCTVCCEPIEADRMEFDPHSQLCRECEEYRDTLKVQ